MGSCPRTPHFEKHRDVRRGIVIACEYEQNRLRLGIKRNGMGIGLKCGVYPSHCMLSANECVLDKFAEVFARDGIMLRPLIGLAS